MGYESSGSGTFKIRPGKDITEAIEKLKEAYFEVDNDRELIRLSFGNWRIYNSEEELKIVQEYLNGEFYITGDDTADIWKLIFEDGKVFIQKSKIVFEDKQEISGINTIWG